MTALAKFRPSALTLGLAIALPIITGLPITASAVPDVAAESQLRRPLGVSIDPTETSPPEQSAAAESSSRARTLPSSTDGGRGEDPLAVRLAPPDGTHSAAESRSGLSGLMGGPLTTIIGALAVTLGVFAVFVALSRRAGGGSGARALPREAFEVIGQTVIGPRQKLMIVRCGVQALVIGVSPAGFQRVAQIDDPDEAGQLIASCRSLGSTAVFRNTLREIEKEPARPGFVEDAPQRPGRGNLFLRA